MKNPAKSLALSINRIDGSRNRLKDDLLGLAPLLNGKELNIDMARAFRRLVLVDCCDGSFIIFTDLG
jgi:hypothetical protein